MRERAAGVGGVLTVKSAPGRGTTIGARTIIAGNAWLTRSVPSDSVASGENDIRPLRHDDPEFFYDQGAFI